MDSKPTSVKCPKCGGKLCLITVWEVDGIAILYKCTSCETEYRPEIVLNTEGKLIRAKLVPYIS